MDAKFMIKIQEHHISEVMLPVYMLYVVAEVNQLDQIVAQENQM